jgi:HK97 family phage prohead protease
METKTKDFAFRVIGKSLDNSGTFTGLASTYGPPADLVGDVVEPGAFRQAIQNQGKGFPLLWSHMQSEPLGLAKISDSPQGLTVNGSLLMSDPAAQRAYGHLKMGSIKGLSIGYQADPADVSFSGDGKVRSLKSVHLHEISLCAVPANPGALVQSVKSLAAVQSVLRGYRPGAVSAADLDQLRSIDATLKGLLRKDAACTCGCDDCVDGNCDDCDDQSQYCQSPKRKPRAGRGVSNGSIGEGKVLRLQLPRVHKLWRYERLFLIAE